MKYNKSLSPVFITLIILLVSQNVICQNQEEVTKNYKNTLKINLTNPMIFSDRSLIFGYERTIGNYQSFSVNFGRFILPEIFDINTDSLKSINHSNKTKGISLSGDYRFYIAKLNKFNSPRGVYIGPYASYNYYMRESQLESNSGQLNYNFKFQVATIGFQLGYQFVFWNRVSLDLLLFGPGVSAYSIKTELGSSLDPDQAEDVYKKINEKLQEKIPGYNLAVNSGDFEKSGTIKTTSLGYRYVIMLGFRF
jgi:hypothetical protein